MRILIVEGETEVSRAIQANLTRENFVCDIAASAREAKEFIAAFVYDCIIVDGDLPEGRATQLLAVLKASRRSEGILMISNPDSLNARKKALNAGADDYLDKPFESSDLTARVCALAHRKQFKGKPTLAHNELAVDLSAFNVTVNGKTVDLTPTEFDLILLFLSNKDRIISQKALWELISGAPHSQCYSLDEIYAQVRNLKRKLGAAGCRNYIRTVHRVGYEFSAV